MARLTPQVTYGAAAHIQYTARLTGSDAAHLHGDCEEPRTIEMRGVEMLLAKQLKAMADPFVDWVGRSEGETHPRFLPGREPWPEQPKVLTVYAKVRCRKCARCLWHKRRQWTAKAIAEVRQSRRTWFGTLTVGPERRFWAKALAESTAIRRGHKGFGHMTPTERTKAIAAVLGPEVTRWLKRVRKSSSAELRYLLVVEPHKDGFPHFHILLHERGGAVSKRQLEKAWTYGFSKWNLVPPGEVTQTRYACKYLTKDAQTRIRASRRYGQLDQELVTERMKAATRACEETTRLSSKTPTQKRRKATH